MPRASIPTIVMTSKPTTSPRVFIGGGPCVPPEGAPMLAMLSGDGVLCCGFFTAVKLDLPTVGSLFCYCPACRCRGVVLSNMWQSGERCGVTNFLYGTED